MELGDDPVAPDEKEVAVDEFLLGWIVFSCIQPGHPIKLFPIGCVPHGLFLSMKVSLFVKERVFFYLRITEKAPASKIP